MNARLNLNNNLDEHKSGTKESAPEHNRYRKTEIDPVHFYAIQDNVSNSSKTPIQMALGNVLERMIKVKERKTGSDVKTINVAQAP